MNNDFKYKKTFLAIASLLSLNSAVYAEEEADSSDLKTILVSGEIPKVGDVQKETIPESRATLSKNELEKFAGLESAMSGALSYLPACISAVQQGMALLKARSAYAASLVTRLDSRAMAFPSTTRSI